jgi:hypothetical protein
MNYFFHKMIALWQEILATSIDYSGRSISVGEYAATLNYVLKIQFNHVIMYMVAMVLPSSFLFAVVCIIN